MNKLIFTLLLSILFMTPVSYAQTADSQEVLADIVENNDLEANYCGYAQRAANDEIRAEVVVNSDWGAGYCANVKLSNTSSVPVVWTAQFEIRGQVNNLWNANWTQNGSILELSGVSWNKELRAGEINTSVGFCANRNAQPTAEPTSIPLPTSTPAPTPTPAPSGKCEDPRPEICPTCWSPVCAVRDDGSQYTSPNSCVACGDSSVTRYEGGECKEVSPTPTPEPIGLCKDPRPEICPSLWDPVCAVRADGSHYTAGNSCSACVDSGVVSYDKGECETVKPTPTPTPTTTPTQEPIGLCTDPRPEICITLWDPVCAQTNEGDQYTAGNACSACSNTSVHSFLPGECPQAQLCTDPRPEVCFMIFDPVCATHLDGGTSTASNGCSACTDASVASYVAGECPEQ